MFNLTGFLKGIGIVLALFIFISFLLGLFNINQIALSLSILYVLCYVLNGVLAPIWNPETPYFASYLASISLTVINLLFAVFVFDVMVFADPAEINIGLVRNSAISLIVSFAVIQILKRKKVLQND
ncbi:hypothetical protein CVD28_23990 [Bacillus sp. M6-12]|uniref:hypothetical protein n=1 Tax=Bacillus sp. M6-12 TaxID=2054166 RepID=UPI000C75F491|nr:hypothetical protein [Bacillus sp. M6-12]PLS15386.1 hypothetical protein CVD28_23990 [Bacillus sp. M6-12]